MSDSSPERKTQNEKPLPVVDPLGYLGSVAPAVSGLIIGGVVDSLLSESALDDAATQRARQAYVEWWVAEGAGIVSKFPRLHTLPGVPRLLATFFINGWLMGNQDDRVTQ